MKQITDFEGRTSDEVEVEYISTISGVIPVYSIKSYHSLTQFIGYVKYINTSGVMSIYEDKLHYIMDAYLLLCCGEK